ncbi:MAG: DUF4349 domain-containing protein [Mongoliibacter sp.]|uniref:DUF4349 domain-containing protein n=1 Tax=Mongoliibacter sp. TaxID=2022438 RepID=UPI0012F13AF1|nr:DUF4349 domain-containing protein [Mongoliibacter sp.]TVP49721.1 MAG: DUF4349 domain-containing protein [Mongoliibacter sp.]
MKKINGLYLVFSVFLFAFSCGNGSYDGDISSDFEEFLDIPLSEQPPPPPEEGTFKEKQTTSERKMIRRGYLEISSGDLQSDYASIKELVSGFNGYLDSENLNNQKDRVSYNLNIRIPSEAYINLMDTLSSIGVALINKSSNVEDVTNRYRDLEATLKSKKMLEERYQELLSKSSEIKDMIEIERNLNNIRNEIEMNESRFRSLSNDIAYSTVSIYIYQDLRQSAVYSDSFGGKLMKSFSKGWDLFVYFVLFLVRLWPFTLLGLLTWALVVRIRRKNNKVQN